MCVISVNEFARLTDEQVSQMWEANSHGGGVAWRESVDGVPVVRWHKYLNKEEMLKMNRELPLPHILHFRIPSADASKHPLACHPFGVSDNADLDFEGITRGSVLFHNGFWNNWRDKIQNIAINGVMKLPSGPWSDSRGLAWATSHLGTGFLEMVNEKVVLFGPGQDDIELFGTWYTIDAKNEDGQPVDIYVSNKTWESRVVPPGGHTTHGTSGSGPNITSLMSTKTQGQSGGTVNPETFRGISHEAGTSTGSGETKQEKIQQEIKGFGEGVAGRNGQSILITCSNSKCHKVIHTGQVLNDRIYCWQCWAERTKIVESKLIGMCETCKVTLAGAKRLSSDTWICEACWGIAGKPLMYFPGGNKKNYD